MAKVFTVALLVAVVGMIGLSSFAFGCSVALDQSSEVMASDGALAESYDIEPSAGAIEFADCWGERPIYGTNSYGSYRDDPGIYEVRMAFCHRLVPDEDVVTDGLTLHECRDGYADWFNRRYDFRGVGMGIMFAEYICAPHPSHGDVQ